MIRCVRGLSVAAALLSGLAAPGAGRAAGIVIDHTTTDPSAIPSAALDAARALTMSFSHASVGGNIWAGLGRLEAEDESRYAFPNWSENDRGNPGWQAKVDDFEDYVAAHLAGNAVFLNKLCYIDQAASFTYYRDSMVRLAGLHPAKTFVWFTIPLMTEGSDNALRAAFNASVRAYVRTNGLVLYDIADIESHRPDGSAVTSGGSEALFDGYSSDGGHLNETGQRRMAGAMWQLMARLGGWVPSGGPVCGNATCESGETAATCAADCASTDPAGSSSGCASAPLGGAGALLGVLVPLLTLRRRRRQR
jgi:hypothetical protein